MFELNIHEQSQIYDTQTLYDLIIIGGGPAGLNAALYAMRKGLNILIIDKDFGGQLHNTSEVENYLGTISLSGKALADRFVDHIKAYEIKIISHYVSNIKKAQHDFYVTLDNKKVLSSKTVLIATGANPKKLDIPGERDYESRGVSYCTICDAPFYKDKEVVVAGGGNSALESAFDLLPYAKKITIIHRSQFRADDILLKKLKNHPEIEIHLETTIIEAKGDDKLSGLIIKDNKTLIEREFKTEGLFISIGVKPNHALIKDLVSINVHGEVETDKNQMTSLKGLFAAGDITNTKYKQIIIAASQGATAALAVSDYITYEYKKETI